MISRRPPLVSVTLISGAALAYEILLMRLFAIIQWHHFAHMIIGLALLGYGLSGTVVALAQKWLRPRFKKVYTGCLALFGASAWGCYAAAQEIPFNPQEILWHGSQAIYLLMLFGLLALPFFFVATAICLTLHIYGQQAGSVYACDLAGAGLGCLCLLAGLYAMSPSCALTAVTLTGLAAAVTAAWELDLPKRTMASLAALVLPIGVLLLMHPLDLKMSPYKQLVQQLRIKGARVVAERSSPLGYLSVLRNDRVPLRMAPGLSLRNQQEPLPQLAIFTDGANPTIITRAPADRHALAYLDQMSGALPYHLKSPGRVLILGAGGGSDILLARYHGAPAIHAVERNPQVIELMRGPYRDFSGNLFGHAAIRLQVSDIRGFVRQTRDTYDLIQLSLIDGFNASGAGLYALNESYVYTVEALVDYLTRLTPEGYLVITRWARIPPREAPKLIATAAAALRKKGVLSVSDHLILIRSWQTSTLMIKRAPFTKAEIRSVFRFCEQRAFDVAFGPGLAAEQANRFNRLPEPYFFTAARALTGAQAQRFMADYKFNLQPATDDRPYFQHFFKWSAFPEIWRLRARGGAALVESGYLVLVATLLVAVLLSLLMILLPLWVSGRNRGALSRPRGQARTMLFFFIIGVAFMLVEIAAIQRFIRFLHHPIYALATCLTAFLVFAGGGSFVCGRKRARRGISMTLIRAVTAIAGISLLHALFLPKLFILCGNLPLVVKLLTAIGALGPLAFFMGMPLPLAIRFLTAKAPDLIPWAWGANGCASVIGASLATLLAIHFGFTFLTATAVALYLMAGWLGKVLDKGF